MNRLQHSEDRQASVESGSVRDRLNDAAARHETTPAERLKPRARPDLRLKAIVLALTVTIMAFVSVAINKPHNTYVPKEQATAMLDPRLRPEPEDAAASANFKQLVAALKEIQGPGWASRNGVARNGDPAKLETFRLARDRATMAAWEKAIRAGPFASRELIARESKPYGLFAQSIANMDQHQGASKNGQRWRAYKVALSLYPVFAASKGPSMAFMAHANAAESVDVVRHAAITYWLGETLEAEQARWIRHAGPLQEVLDSMPSASHVRVAERSQILAIVNGSIIPQLCDPYERERARRKLEASPTALPMEVSPNARVNVPLSIGTMNRVLTQVARDLDQPWWKRDTKIADLLFRPEGGFTIELGAAQENLLMRPINAFRDPNLGGRAVLALYAPEIASLAQAGTRAETDYEAARTLLALDIYSRKHHSQWAGSLEALVKDGILRKVPIDPFSGKPLLYLPGKRIVYSVGPDAKDDGGNTKIFAGQGRDIAYWL